MLVFPGFGDQPVNARSLVEKNMALPLASLTYSEISSKLDAIMEPSKYSEMQKSLRKSKILMTSLGGFSKAAEIVEKVSLGEVTVDHNPDKLFDVLQECKQFLFMNGIIFLALLYISVKLFLLTCRRRLKMKKS